MPPSPPAILGPVSECSRAVRVVGQFSGARVRVYVDADPVPVGDQQVDWADALVAVDRSRLAPGQRLRATQEVSGQEGGRSPAGQPVEPAINGPVVLPYPLYICAQSLYVRGCSPGSRLEVWQSGSLLGRADAVGDDAWITFDPGERVSPGSGLEVRQRVCTSPTVESTSSVVPVPAPTQNERRMHPPALVEPLEECVALVSVTGVAPGAVLRMRRDGGTVFDESVPHDAVNVRVGALRTGELFEVEQAMPLCELQPADPARAEVVALTALPRPRIDGPICAGPHQVNIARLKPGATVILLADNTEIGRWEAGAASMPVDLDVPVPAALTARQELCGILSPTSRPYYAASARSGRWFRVEDDKGDDLLARSFAIHVALAHTGQVVIFSGDQHSAAQHRANPQDIDHCELLDTATLTLRKIDAPSTDVFCSGHAFLPDGRLLVGGGTEGWRIPQPVEGEPARHHIEHFPGLPTAWIFDPYPDDAGRHWSRTDQMRAGRWYPSLLTLPNGAVLALSGHPHEADARHNNNSMETYAGGRWTHLGDSAEIDSGESRYLYPRILGGPRGDVFSATPVLPADERLPRTSATWTPGTGVTWQRNSGPPAGAWGRYDDFYTPATLLPLLEEEDFRFRVLRAGDAGATSGWVIDLGTPGTPAASPTWTQLGSRSPEANGRLRENSNIVLLASGEVLVCGGVQDAGQDTTAVHQPELLVRGAAGWGWDPSAFAAATVPRNYHSTALLLPDGRVFTGGGSINANQGGADVRRLEVELYEPWYVCRPRPRIVGAPLTVRSGQRLVVDVRGPGPIDRLALVRCGSTTHGFNSDQRYLGLVADEIAPGRHLARVPAPAVAVPGYYLLFALTEAGVPSAAVFLRVDRTR